jgi:hypothetical protein
MDNIFESLLGLFKKTHDFLIGLNIPYYVFFALVFIVFIWMFITNRKIKRLVGSPLKKIDKEIKKKQDELDREKVAIKASAQKEIKKMKKAAAEQKAEVAKEIKELKDVMDEQDVEAELKTEAKKKPRTKKASQKVKVKQKVQEEPPVQVEPEPEPAPEPEPEPAPEPEPEPAPEPEPEPAPEPEPEPAPEPEPEPAPPEPPAEPKEEFEPLVIPEQEVQDEVVAPVEKKPKKIRKVLPIKDKKTKLTSEQFFILSAIGDEPDKTYQEEALYKIYKMAFSDREKDDFDQAVKKLEKLNFIALEKPSGYRLWLKITDKGIGHYREGDKK